MLVSDQELACTSLKMLRETKKRCGVGIGAAAIDVVAYCGVKQQTERHRSCALLRSTRRTEDIAETSPDSAGLPPSKKRS
jgi:hypothetical protein